MNLELVWHEDFYDVPLSGVAKLNGEYVWMQLKEMDEETEEQTFGLYSMKPEQKAEVFRRHKLFQECVGYNCDHHPDVFKPFGATDHSRFDEFYSNKFKRLDLQRDDNLIMEVDWTQFKYWGRPRYNKEST